MALQAHVGRNVVYHDGGSKHRQAEDVPALVLREYPDHTVMLRAFVSYEPAGQVFDKVREGTGPGQWSFPLVDTVEASL